MVGMAVRIDFHEASFNSSLLNYFVRATSWPSTKFLALRNEWWGYNLAVRTGKAAPSGQSGGVNILNFVDERFQIVPLIFSL